MYAPLSLVAMPDMKECLGRLKEHQVGPPGGQTSTPANVFCSATKNQRGRQQGSNRQCAQWHGIERGWRWLCQQRDVFARVQRTMPAPA